MTSLDAKNHFGRVVDSSQREPVVVTRHSRPMVGVIIYPDFIKTY